MNSYSNSNSRATVSINSKYMKNKNISSFTVAVCMSLIIETQIIDHKHEFKKIDTLFESKFATARSNL